MNKNNEQKINITGWQPIEEYFKETGRYDWVLVKYFDADYECVPDVMEYRHSNTEEAGWYNRTDHKLEDCFTPKYFFDIQQLEAVCYNEGQNDEWQAKLEENTKLKELLKECRDDYVSTDLDDDLLLNQDVARDLVTRINAAIGESEKYKK